MRDQRPCKDDQSSSDSTTPIGQGNPIGHRHRTVLWSRLGPKIKYFIRSFDRHITPSSWPVKGFVTIYSVPTDPRLKFLDVFPPLLHCQVNVSGKSAWRRRQPKHTARLADVSALQGDKTPLSVTRIKGLFSMNFCCLIIL